MATCEWQGCTREAENIGFAFRGATKTAELCDQHLEEAERLVKETEYPYPELRQALGLPGEGTNTAHGGAGDGL
jgi:hypothetical protein